MRFGFIATFLSDTYPWPKHPEEISLTVRKIQMKPGYTGFGVSYYLQYKLCGTIIEGKEHGHYHVVILKYHISDTLEPLNTLRPE